MARGRQARNKTGASSWRYKDGFHIEVNSGGPVLSVSSTWRSLGLDEIRSRRGRRDRCSHVEAGALTGSHVGTGALTRPAAQVHRAAIHTKLAPPWRRKTRPIGLRIPPSPRLKCRNQLVSLLRRDALRCTRRVRSRGLDFGGSYERRSQADFRT